MKKSIATTVALAAALSLSATATTGSMAAETESAPAAVESITAQSTSYTVTAAWLNVRTGPSVNYRSLGAIPRGTVISGQKLSNGWVKFTYQGRTAYSSGHYLTSPRTVDEANYTVRAAWLNVRTGPSVRYQRLTSIPRGTIITGQKLSNGWVKFQYKGRTAYVSGVYLTTGTTPKPDPKPEEPKTVVRHVVQQDGDLFVDVYDRKVASSAYDVHYLPRGGMVKGVIEGSWFRMPGNKYVPMSDLTTRHTSYTNSNGRHDPSGLCAMQGSEVSSHVLTACGAIKDLKGLNRAYAARFGEDLPWDECYRTYDTQVAYRKAFGPKAAVPGYSNHGSLNRPACDAPEQAWKFGFHTERYEWLTTNGPRFGWIHPSWAKPSGSNPEYWHFEYTG